MTCPFCGASVIFSLDGVPESPESYECGSGDLRQSEPCRELCQLREKKAQELTWEEVGWFSLTRGLGGSLIINTVGVHENPKGVWRLSGVDNTKAPSTFASKDAAKAHAEELHQQAWRELRNKWDYKGGGK